MGWLDRFRTPKDLLDKMKEAAKRPHMPDPADTVYDYACKIEIYKASVEDYIHAMSPNKIWPIQQPQPVNNIIVTQLTYEDLQVWFAEMVLTGVEVAFMGKKFELGGQPRMTLKVRRTEDGFMLDMPNPVTMRVNAHIDGIGLFRNAGDLYPTFVGELRIANPDVAVGASVVFNNIEFKLTGG